MNRLRRYVTEAGIAPDLVLCSSARRTVMTLEGIASALPADTNVDIEAGPYGASSDELLGRLHDVRDDVASVLLIGHNPGLESLASLLIGDGDEGPRQRVAKFPTGALAIVALTAVGSISPPPQPRWRPSSCHESCDDGIWVPALR